MARETGSPVVGVVGGGQLARMTLNAAARLGVHAIVLASPHDEAARGIWPHVETGDPLDPRVLDSLSRRVDVMTFDHENVDPEVIEALARLGRVVRPGASVLRLCDKSAQRTQLATLGFSVPPFSICTTLDDICSFASSHGGWPVVAKVPRGGYDGRGVQWLDGEEQALFALAMAGDRATLIVEPALAVERELAVLVARRPGGEHVVYPVVETFQRGGTCQMTVAPAVGDPDLIAEAVSVTVELADLVDAVGLLAVEFFVVGGTLLVNEIAPRPHNSGHFTIDGCVTSQFENHLRAVLDWPLGSTGLVAPAVATVNVFGSNEGTDPRALVRQALELDDVRVHLYGKSPRPGRKLGHVTVTAADPATAVARAVQAGEVLNQGWCGVGEAAR